MKQYTQSYAGLEYGHLNQATTNRGFTLIELLVVVAIIGILIGLATPSMSKFVADWRVNSAMNSLSRDFRLARSEAIKRSRPVVLCRANSAYTGCANGTEWKTGWLVFVDNDFGGTYTSAKDELLMVQRDLPGIGALQTERAITFTFIPNGLLKRTARTARFTAQSALGGGSPMAEQQTCVAVSGRMRKLLPGQNCTG